MVDEADKLTVLVMSDRHTGLCLALPAEQKCGCSLIYLATEMSRFVMYCGHSEIGLRCDGEPSILALLEAVQKALAALNVVVHSEPTPVGDRQANGAAEAMVRVLRAKANLLVQQIEESTGCPGPTFGCLHPAYSWAHSCSLVTQSLNFASKHHVWIRTVFWNWKVLQWQSSSVW